MKKVISFRPFFSNLIILWVDLSEPSEVLFPELNAFRTNFQSQRLYSSEEGCVVDRHISSILIGCPFCLYRDIVKYTERVRHVLLELIDSKVSPILHEFEMSAVEKLLT